MPRNARIDKPGLLQHVIVRGIERRPIFLDEQDRKVFLLRLGQLLKDSDTDCFAWTLLDNHFHLLLRPNRQRLAELMRRLLTGYAVVFNLRHKRSGHLFQNRYKSLVCDQDAYLLELVRYIHLNPVRAGVVEAVEALGDFPWSGHRELLAPVAAPLIRVDEVLSLFGRRKKTARENYLRFLADGLGVDKSLKLSSGGKRVSRALNPSLSEDDRFDDRVLGGGVFVEDLLGVTDMAAAPSVTFDELLQRVAGHFQVEPERLRLGGKERPVARAKAVVCALALRQLGMSGTEVAERVGLSPSGVTLATRRGERLLREEEGLAESVMGA